MLSEGKICGEITYAQMGDRARQIASLLKQLGIANGGKVLLLSENCPEWALAYFGIALAGAVSVPLLTGFSIEQIQYIASHSDVSAVCISRAMAQKFEQIYSLSGFLNIPFIYIDSMTDNKETPKISVSLNGLEKEMPLHTDECTDVPQQKADDLASIIYTSGTQGSNKGVMLSSRNLISSAVSSLFFGRLVPRDRMLSVLPLAHSYECGLGLLAPVISGVSITYLDRPPSPSVLLPAVKLLRPTVMVTVPLLIEKIYSSAIAPKLRESKLYKFPLTRPLAVWFAGRKLVSALGGRIRFFGIGGAPLSPQVEKFLHNAKFPYTIGYGLTETAPLVASNIPLRFSFGFGLTSADGVTIRIAECEGSAKDGEIQVRGQNVMMGYYNDEEKTREAFTSDGWFRTGDLGRLDKKGRLHIRGRLKALILGPSGENIYPEEIEGLLGSSQLVEESLVYSGKKGELIALVFLSEAAKAAAGAIEHKLEDLRLWVNKKLSSFSRLSKIEIKYKPFEKTPTMKIKRHLYA